MKSHDQQRFTTDSRCNARLCKPGIPFHITRTASSLPRVPSAVSCDSNMPSDSDSSTTYLLEYGNQLPNRKISEDGTCETTKQIYTRYCRLRKFFYILCMVNVLVIVIALSAVGYLFYRLSITKDGQRFPTQPQIPNIDSGNSKMVTMFSSKSVECVILKNRLNNTVQLKGNCSLEDLANNAAKIFRKESILIHMVGGVPEKTSSKGNGDHRVIDWREETRQFIAYSARSHAVIVPVTGYYFLYSKIVFDVPRSYTDSRSTVNIKHSFARKSLNDKKDLIIDSSTIKCSNNKFVHNSLLQRVLYLEAGDEIGVIVSHDNRIKLGRTKENSFGMFKI